MTVTKFRAGKYVRQRAGYKAFIPASLPPDPPILMDSEMIRLLSSADRTLARLDGVATTLPNPDLFVTMYVRHEAVLSSQIEGTQSTLEDVLQFEAGARGRRQRGDVVEVFNYVNAMKHGLQLLQRLPLSLRLIREIHKRLLKGVRGQERNPGEFRRSQNWIGPSQAPLSEAVFIPPPAHEMDEALGNLDKFLHDHESLPELIQCGLVHAQFETIHPFLDGNGRVGRLLITLMLCERRILQHPLLYLSYYLQAHRREYYDRLMAIRNSGDWEGWLKFFLRGVYQVSIGATKTAREIHKLREQDRSKISEHLSGSSNGHRLLDYLFQQPVLNVGMAKSHLNCSDATAGKIIDGLAGLGILQEMTGHRRNRIFRYGPYVKLFEHQILEESTTDMPANPADAKADRSKKLQTGR